ncbi:MAG: Fic family protein [Chitinispirillia bacterium]|nr:Fic family protein [Chitinispirillia bacterium]MCL2242386.1 Fic family protein [Chitinispirillia bacterium]
MITIGINHVKWIHEEQIANVGGAGGVRDEDLLVSALTSPFQTFGGTELYPSTSAKIARITYGLVRNHPFMDGNKRTGTELMMLLLKLNHIVTDISEDELVDTGLKLGNGTMSAEALQEFIDNKTINQ